MTSAVDDACSSAFSPSGRSERTHPWMSREELDRNGGQPEGDVEFLITRGMVLCHQGLAWMKRYCSSIRRSLITALTLRSS